VYTITGTGAPFRSSARSTSNPSMPGISRSSTTQSTGAVARISIAFSPVGAVSTS
jgi:hypothetical protein